MIAIRPTPGMKTTYSAFRLAEIHETDKVGDPTASVCVRCLCVSPIFKLKLNDAGEFICATKCEEYKNPVDNLG